MFEASGYWVSIDWSFGVGLRMLIIGWDWSDVEDICVWNSNGAIKDTC